MTGQVDHSEKKYSERDTGEKWQKPQCGITYIHYAEVHKKATFLVI